jgi:hypothetical protein
LSPREPSRSHSASVAESIRWITTPGVNPSRTSRGSSRTGHSSLNPGRRALPPVTPRAADRRSARAAG